MGITITERAHFNGKTGAALPAAGDGRAELLELAVGVVGEVEHGLGDLLRPAEAAQRDLPCELVERFAAEHLHHVGVDHAGRDAVDPDAGRGELRRE